MARIIGPAVMDRLSRHIGQRVKVEYVERGQLVTATRILRHVSRFNGVFLTQLMLDFVSWRHGIRQIAAEDGEVLYENPLITEDWLDGHGDEQIEQVRKATFGRWAE
jgi:hypothetical protein